MMTFRTRLALSDTWLLELFLALYTILWGLWYANPYVATMANNPSMALLIQFPGGETAFGLLTLVLGVAKLSALAGGVRRLRGLVCALLGVFWLLVAVSIAIPTHWSAGGIPHFLLVSLANWFLWARLRYAGRR